MIRLYTDDDYLFSTSAPEANTVLNGVYFHGNAESILGHDIVCIPGILQHNLTEGVRDFEVRDSTHNHQILTGKLYLWNTKYGFKGLAIEAGDSAGFEYAKSCFESHLGNL
jgi:hypothetical protein